MTAQRPPTVSPKPHTDQAQGTLQQYLATARTESAEYLQGDSLPVGTKVRALVEAQPRSWWDGLSALENFFLFEISPATAARAPAAVRAEAFCAGVAEVNAEWWSVPGSRNSETTKHVIASGAPVTKCLVDLFDNTRPLSYADGETGLLAEQLGWTRADLAAGVVALVLGEKYQSRSNAGERAVRRDELRAKVQ